MGSKFDSFWQNFCHFEILSNWSFCLELWWISKYECHLNPCKQGKLVEISVLFISSTGWLENNVFSWKIAFFLTYTPNFLHIPEKTPMNDQKNFRFNSYTFHVDRLYRKSTPLNTKMDTVLLYNAPFRMWGWWVRKKLGNPDENGAPPRRPPISKKIYTLDLCSNYHNLAALHENRSNF